MQRTERYSSLPLRNKRSLLSNIFRERKSTEIERDDSVVLSFAVSSYRVMGRFTLVEHRGRDIEFARI